MEKSEWHSQRWQAEQKLERDIAAFDRLVDMAIDGTITMQEAIEAFKTEAIVLEEVNGA